MFVLTHHPREPLPMQGATTFYFVTDGIESAQARAVAGDMDVSIAGEPVLEPVRVMASPGVTRVKYRVARG